MGDWGGRGCVQRACGMEGGSVQQAKEHGWIGGLGSVC